jgi:hypothetical protein
MPLREASSSDAARGCRRWRSTFKTETYRFLQLDQPTRDEIDADGGATAAGGANRTDGRV